MTSTGSTDGQAQLRALLLTDVVDSARLSEELGDAAMARLWAAHDRAARDLLRAWRGREIDKSDGMLLLFDAAADAAGYALAYRRALAGLHVPMKARAGLHVGPVILRENRAEDVALGAKPLEVDGVAKPTAARVMSVAIAGQTLMTEEARQALGQTDLRVESHGYWQLKGIAQPIELFEVGDAQSSFTAPPDGEKVYRVVRTGDEWMPARDLPNNLPQHTTSFVGRERERVEIRRHLRNTRLLTLLGMGGLGKTRLSQQVAADTIAEYPDGAWFLDLAPIRDPSLVASEAAQILGVREEPGRPLLQTLCAELKTRTLLLIVDNCEHMMGPSAELVDAILRATAGVRVISTSREGLHVPGEQLYQVHPLPVPKATDGLEAVSRSTAVQLFVERAKLHKPLFVLTEKDAPAVAELVARLEGIPLALELAAARIRQMSVADINAKLKDRYRVLTGGGRVLLERQQTLRALVDWSYDMLSEQERIVLERLGVFAGGFELPAAEKICGTDPLASEDILDLVSSLADKSLLMMEERPEELRYRMLETIRDYAREKLGRRGEQAGVAARHCDYYFVMAKEANRGAQRGKQAEWTRRVNSEMDNLRAAIALALAGGVDPFIAVKIAVAMQGFWMLGGQATEGRGYVRAALALPAIQASPLAQSHALYVGAALADSQSDLVEAKRMLETCLELRRGLGDPLNVAATLSTLSLARLHSGDAEEARSGEEEALKIFREVGNRVGEAIGLLHLGQIHAHLGEEASARRCAQECLACAREINHLEVESECERMLGELAIEAGDLAQARARIERSEAICKESGDKHGEATTQWYLGKLDLLGGDADAAQLRLGAALKAFEAFEMRQELLGCLEDHATLARARGAEDHAARLCAAVASARERLGLVRTPRAQARWKDDLEAMRQSLGGAAFDAACAEGLRWDTAETIRRALSPEGAPALA